MRSITDVLGLVLVLAPGLELVLGLVREKSIEWHATCFGEWSVASDIQLPHESLPAVSRYDLEKASPKTNHLHHHPHEPIIGRQNEDTHEPDESEQV